MVSVRPNMSQVAVVEWSTLHIWPQVAVVEWSMHLAQILTSTKGPGSHPGSAAQIVTFTGVDIRFWLRSFWDKTLEAEPHYCLWTLY